MPTAIFIVYTREGFVIAADGLKRKGELNDAVVITDSAQKIFSIEDPGRSLAYALAGTVGIGHVDVGLEIDKAAKILAAKRFVNQKFYVEKLCQPVHRLLLRARASGEIEYPNNPDDMCDIAPIKEHGLSIARLFMVGYYEGNPSLVSVRFFHQNQVLGPLEPQIQPFLPGDQIGYGSSKVWGLLKMSRDKRFAKYRSPSLLSREATTIM